MEPIYTFLADILRPSADGQCVLAQLRAEIAAGAVKVEVSGLSEPATDGRYFGEVDELREVAIDWMRGAGMEPRIPITTKPHSYVGCLAFEESGKTACFMAGKMWADSLLDWLRKGSVVALFVEGAPPLVVVVFYPVGRSGAAASMVGSAAAGVL